MTNHAVDLADPLDSARYHRYLTDFHTDLVTQHGNDPLVQEFASTLGTTRCLKYLVPGRRW